MSFSQSTDWQIWQIFCVMYFLKVTTFASVMSPHEDLNSLNEELKSVNVHILFLRDFHTRDEFTTAVE